MERDELLDFFRKLDRSLFLDKEFREYADCDSPLPIGYRQTISQPSLVLEKTRLLNLSREMRVLEIGTGSGYQTAFLARFAREVYTVEIIEELSLKAQKRLAGLGFKNIRFKVGDGSQGWPEHAPYDRIIVTAGASKVPDPLLEQLSCGGLMVIPVGTPSLQDLLLVEKNKDGSLSQKPVGKVVFVELKGEYGWRNR